jgi:hypothetical protein
VRDAVCKGRHRQLRGRAELAHVLERHDDLEVELLPRSRVDELDVAVGSGDEAADLGQRALRGREADALERALRELLEALERQRQMRSALRAGDRVDLVEDHRLDPAQGLPGLRGEQEEERLGGRDEDVRRRPEHAASLVRGRVAGSNRDGELGAKAGERAAQVPLDVVVQGLERRDVEEAQPLPGGRV